MDSYYLTDTGRVREHNEDSVTIIKNLNDEYLLAVADGMGGHKAGEVASSIVIEHLTKAFNEMEKLGDKASTVKWLRKQVEEINVYKGQSYKTKLKLKKGTYYIRVRGYSKYSLDATFTPLSDVGSSKSSAKYVSKTGKNTVAIMPVGEPSNRCDWYKFYVPYRQTAVEGEKQQDRCLRGGGARPKRRACPRSSALRGQGKAHGGLYRIHRRPLGACRGLLLQARFLAIWHPQNHHKQEPLYPAHGI